MKIKSNISKDKKAAAFARTIAKFLKNAEKNYLPGISIDTVIFSFHNDSLKLLLIRYGDMPYYNLPGGYVEKNETLNNAAIRLLKRRTGLDEMYLKQFYLADNIERLQEHAVTKLMKDLKVDLPPGNWFEQRFVSACYYSLTDKTKVTVNIQDFISEYKWFDVGELPDLFLDHKKIIEEACKCLRIDLERKPIGMNLMKETFTMGELQKLYEDIHQRKFDRNNFKRKILSMNILERLEKKYTGKPHKSPYLYRFALTKK